MKRITTCIDNAEINTWREADSQYITCVVVKNDVFHAEDVVTTTQQQAVQAHFAAVNRMTNG